MNPRTMGLSVGHDLHGERGICEHSSPLTRVLYSQQYRRLLLIDWSHLEVTEPPPPHPTPLAPPQNKLLL